MKYGLFLNLQMFAEGGEGGNSGNNGSDTGNKGNGATYSFEQAEEIANSRAERASRSALTNYFKQQGMSEEEAQEAFKDFKAKKAAGQPDVAGITRERDEARAELASYKNRSVLSELNVDSAFTEFVEGKVKAMVTDKKDFKTAAGEFLKANPQYVKSGYKFSTGSQGENKGGAGNDMNSYMNSLIRGK